MATRLAVAAALVLLTSLVPTTAASETAPTLQELADAGLALDEAQPSPWPGCTIGLYFEFSFTKFCIGASGPCTGVQMDDYANHVYTCIGIFGLPNGYVCLGVFRYNYEWQNAQCSTVNIPVPTGDEA